MVKECTCCGIEKSLESFHKEKRGLFGRASRCKECKAKYRQGYYAENKITELENRATYRTENREKVRACKLKRRALEMSLPSDLSKEDVTMLLSSGCFLTGETNDVQLDHFIPIAWGFGGTIIENMLPLSARLNQSKAASNPFEWIKTRDDIDMERWNEAIEHLAILNGMTSAEFEEYVYECAASRKRGEAM